MNEVDAKTKRCPLSMVPSSRLNLDKKCIASDCMAWRWAKNQPGVNLAQGELPAKGRCGLVK